MPDIHLVNAAIQQSKDGPTIIRGTLTPESLKNLRVDAPERGGYQREVLAATGRGKRSSIMKAIEEGGWLPDVILGMRGNAYSSKGTSVVLHDPVFIVDGLQRVSTYLKYMDDHDGVPNGAVPIGATVEIASTRAEETERFGELNGPGRVPVSANVLLRNVRAKHPSIATLYGLTHNETAFPLYGRVTWNQRKKRGEILTANTLMRSAVFIHRYAIEETAIKVSKKAKKGGAGENSARLPVVLDRVAGHIGLDRFRHNVIDFFTLIDECWGIQAIEYGEAQGHLKGNFLAVLGAFISQNESLWDGKRQKIKIDRKTKDRLRTFPVNDPEIRRLAAAGTMVIPLLYNFLLNHMNKYKPENLRFK